MSDELDTRELPERPAGIIKCLTLGFEITARNPQLILIPILLDLYLWLGPRLSLEPLVADVRALWATAPAIEFAPAYQLFNEIFDLIATRYNLFALLNFSPLLGVPGLMGVRMTVDRPFGPRPEVEVLTMGAALGWASVVIVAGLAFSALYLWQIGMRVSRETETPVPGPLTVAKLWGYLVQLVVLLIGVSFIFSFPISFLVSFLSMFSPNLGGMAITMLLVIVFFIILHALYVVPGMVQLCQPPFQAFRESVALTRVDFMGTSGLFLVMIVVTQGLNFVWMLPDASKWATLVGIGGHALVSTALVMTLFIFYQERLVYLRMLRHAYAANRAQSHADM